MVLLSRKWRRGNFPILVSTLGGLILTSFYIIAYISPDRIHLGQKEMDDYREIRMEDFKIRRVNDPEHAVRPIDRKEVTKTETRATAPENQSMKNEPNRTSPQRRSQIQESCYKYIERSAERKPPTETPFKIYVYDVPTRFNYDLMNCVQKRYGYCFNFENCGMGAPMHKTADMATHDSHMFALEVIIHQKMLLSPYRTFNQSEADAFYLPVYGGLACLCHPIQGPDIDAIYRDYFRYLLTLEPYLRGRPHFSTLGKIEREESGSYCPYLGNKLNDPIAFFGIEHENNANLRAYYHVKAKVITAPYPSYAHFRTTNEFDFAKLKSRVNKTLGAIDSVMNVIALGHVRNASEMIAINTEISRLPNVAGRNVFTLLAASGRASHETRKILQPQMRRTTSSYKQFVKDEAITGHDNDEKLKSIWLETNECSKIHKNITLPWMRRTQFCLQPPGDSPTRKSIYDGLASGCVPVFFADRLDSRHEPVAWPFAGFIDYSDISVTVPYALYKKYKIREILEQIPNYEVERLLSNVRAVNSIFQYSLPLTSGPHTDAVALLLEELRLHFKL